MESLLDPIVCHIPKPRKKPLVTKETLPNLPPQLQNEGLSQVLNIIGDSLYTWADWSVKLPPSQLTPDLEKPYDPPNFSEIFVHQDFEEYQVLAKDEHHRSRRLSAKQLRQLRNLGRFDVESRDFPGHQHSWHISGALQKGQKRINSSLKIDLLKALRFLVVGAGNRFVGDFFSIKVAAFAFTDFFGLIFDLFFGLPHVHHDDIDRRLLEERLEFSVGDLTVKTANRHVLEAFWSFAERVSYFPDNINLGDEGRAPVPPYQFITPSKLPIDLRIYDNQVLERSLVVINQLRQEVHDNWFEDFKNDLYITLKRAGKPNDEIKDIICARGLNEYAKRLFEAMRNSEALTEIDPTIAEVLIHEATFSLAVMETKASLCEAWLAHKAETEARMQQTHPILWLISPWRKQKMAQVKAAFIQEHRFDVHRAVIEKCKSLDLKQYGYFVQRDLLFLTERESRIREELIRTSVSPDNRFVYRVPCKLMRNWRVYRCETVFPHHRERVDSVLLLRNYCVDQEEAEMKTRSTPQHASLAVPCEQEYCLKKHWVFKTSTRYAFWRWYTFLVATFVLLIHSSQLFLFTIPFNSPVSFTALFQKNPIQLSADVDQKTGYLYYTNERQCPTLHSRLVSLWSSSRAAVASGGSQRGFAAGVRSVCIYFSASVLSLLLVLLLPPLCVVCSSLSIICGLLALLVLPALSLVFHLFCVILWDFYKPATHPNRLFPIFEAFLWHLGIRCVAQFILALLCGLLLYPLLALTTSLFAIVRWTLRSTWDGVIYYLCLRPCLRIPARNNCIFRRRAGPGLSPMHFYRARLADVCAILEGQLEAAEIDEWRAQMEVIAKEPIRAYNSLAESLAWLSLSPVEKGVFSQLRGQTKAWLEEIYLKARQRKVALHPRFPRCQATRLKLSANELQKFIIIGSTQTQKFYETRILPRLQLLNRNPEDWWSQRGLRTDDFSGLCMRLMKNVLGEQFLTSLKETDTVFPLHVRQKNIVSRFALVVPPTPYIARRFTSAATDAPVVSTEPSPRDKTVEEQPEKQIQLSSPNKATGSSLPSDLGGGKSPTVHQPPASNSFPQISSSKSETTKPRGGDSDQPSIDVDSSAMTTPLGNSKRQTVIFASVNKPSETRVVEEEDTISVESLVFIHIELPLFPLSAFVPRALQEAAAVAKSNKNDGKYGRHPHFPTNSNGQKVSEKSPKEQRNGGEKAKPMEGIGTLLKEENVPPPTTGTLPLNVALLPVSHSSPTSQGKTKHISLRQRCSISLRNCIRRTLTRHWKLEKFPRAERELSITSVIENIGRLMHPVDIALTMHSRILEEHKINRDHPILAKYIAELTAFPPLHPPSPHHKSSRNSPLGVSFYSSKLQTTDFSTPDPRASPATHHHFALQHPVLPVTSHSLETQLDPHKSLEAETPQQPRRRRLHDWDDFNLAVWWDVESRRAHDFLETHETRAMDFYTALTDTTTSAYEETEEECEDEVDMGYQEEELDHKGSLELDPLLDNLSEAMIENGRGHYFKEGRATAEGHANGKDVKNKLTDRPPLPPMSLAPTVRVVVTGEGSMDSQPSDSRQQPRPRQR